MQHFTLTLSLRRVWVNMPQLLTDVLCLCAEGSENSLRLQISILKYGDLIPGDFTKTRVFETKYQIKPFIKDIFGCMFPAPFTEATKLHFVVTVASNGLFSSVSSRGPLLNELLYCARDGALWPCLPLFHSLWKPESWGEKCESE